tara:strand:- start:4845 stop:6512 length:1668 start_codon:yes stop_codon:yes gene_type:complete
MQNSIATYQIEILNDSFHFEGNDCDQTVVVKTFVENKLVTKIKYGLVTKEKVYTQLKIGDHINLSRCYVKDFSISEFKKSINHDDLEHIDVNHFVAEDAFFDCSLRTDFSYINFNGIAKFNDTVFSHGNISFYQCRFNNDSPVEFKHVEFGNGEISFQYVEFNNETTAFTGVKFYGGVVSFVNANFKNGDVLFNNVDFYNSRVKFHFAKFGNGAVNFNKARFGDKLVDFRKVEFGAGRVDFRRAAFGNCYVNFDESEIIKGKFNFRSARFGNNDITFKLVNFGEADVLFENVNFGTGQLSFSESTSKYISFKGSRLDVFLDLCVKKAEIIDLSQTVLRDIIDVKPINHQVNIQKLYLNEMRNLGRIIIDWKDNNVLELISNQKKTSLRQKSEQFNILKENFELSGQYNDEDKSYIQFKRFELKADYREAIKSGGTKLFNLPNFAFRWLIFDKMGLFATNPLRVLFSMLVIYVLFSLVYLSLTLFGIGGIVNSVGAVDGLSNIQTCFYHSAITFLTIGYGDYYPTGISRGISILEGWSGLFLMSYFTVAFVRKILR